MDEQQRQEIEARLDQLGRDGEKIAANARYALDRLRRADVQASCDIVALSHYPIVHARVDNDALMAAFTVAGIEPGAGRSGNRRRDMPTEVRVARTARSGVGGLRP